MKSKKTVTIIIITIIIVILYIIKLKNTKEINNISRLNKQETLEENTSNIDIEKENEKRLNAENNFYSNNAKNINKNNLKNCEGKTYNDIHDRSITNELLSLEHKSNGIAIEYLDMYTNKRVSVPEKIQGEINEDYDLSNFNKKIDNYTLVSINGKIKGKLKKEKINITYNLAKKAILCINFLEKCSNKIIQKERKIEGFENKKEIINVPDIEGYNYDSGDKEYTMKPGENIVNIYYVKNEKIKENKNDIQSNNLKR